MDSGAIMTDEGDMSGVTARHLTAIGLAYSMLSGADVARCSAVCRSWKEHIAPNLSATAIIDGSMSH